MTKMGGGKTERIRKPELSVMNNDIIWIDSIKMGGIERK
jgi:hypothetical protein